MDEKLDRIVESLQLLNVHVEGLRVSLTTAVEVANDHEQRLRTLERWQHQLIPILALLIFVCGAVFREVLGRVV